MVRVDDVLRVVETMRHNKLGNYIVAGLDSFMIGDGDKHGKVRLFSCDRDTRDSITPHSHRFDFACLVLRGDVQNTLYEDPTPGSLTKIEPWVVSSIDQVCGVDGIRKFEHVRQDKPRDLVARTTMYSRGEIYYMSSEEIHSIVFRRGSRVLFFEGPPKTDRSYMIEPWVNGKVVPTFKTEDWMFQKDV